MDRKNQLHIWYWAIAVVALVWLQGVVQQARQIETVPYSEFEQRLKSGALTEVTVYSDRIEGTLKQADNGKQRIVARKVDPALASDLERYGVTFAAGYESTLLRDVLSWVAPILVFFLIWQFLVRRMAERGGLGAGLMSIGQSKAKVYVETETKATFADVAGADEAKEELKEIVDFLKAPALHGRLGARIPKGILLVGPPGTGKTLLARAVAGEAGVPFFSISGSEFVEMFVGVGAARVRDLFEQARKRAPAIIFIDELDALGRARGSYVFGGHDEKEQTLNQLLSELDGFDPSSGVVLLGATNRPEVLDPALLRAGRFDRQILMDKPDRRARREILLVHLRKVKTAADVDPDEIAALTPGFSGADLANLVNEAALIATRRDAAAVAAADFTAAVERMVAGIERRTRVLSERERRVIAHHELGHAFVASVLNTRDRVHKVSIIPRGIGALGYTIQRPVDDRYLVSRGELENQMAVLLGGRASEELAFGEVSTGAADDLVKATDIARNMVLRFGMDAMLGDVAFADPGSSFLAEPAAGAMRPREYSDATAREADLAVRKLIATAHQRAHDVLQAHRDALERGVAQLLQMETISGEDVLALLGLRAEPKGAPGEPALSAASDA